MCSYLKFIFDLAGVGLGVQPADVVIEGAELAHRDGRVAAETRFQDGVVHEHVLFLQVERGESGYQGRRRAWSLLSIVHPAPLKGGRDSCCRITAFYPMT